MIPCPVSAFRSCCHTMPSNQQCAIRTLAGKSRLSAPFVPMPPFSCLKTDHPP